MDLPRGALEKFLAQDGLEVPPGNTQERPVHCWSGIHEDKTPSCYVNVNEGVYFCHACENTGTAYHYLVNARGMSPKDAFKKLQEEEGWPVSRINLSVNMSARQERRKEGLPPLLDTIPATKKGGFKKTSDHDYVTATGNLVMRVIRYDLPPSHAEKRRKVYSLYTPAKRGGWWAATATSTSIPDEDRWSALPLYGLPELLKQIAERPKRQIWVVEGEKCVDAVQNVKATNVPPCTTFRRRVDLLKTDFSPLFGRNVLLCADRDEPGRKRMRVLAPYLYQNGANVRLCLPPGEGGYDVAKAIGEGGLPAAIDWIKRQSPFDYAPAAVEDDIPLPDMPLSETEHFKVLGLSGMTVVFQLKTTSEIIALPRVSLHQDGHLYTLADLTWWHETFPELTQRTKISIGNALVRAAERRGFFNMGQRVIGRGAVKSGEDVVFNLGDKLLVKGEGGLLDKEVPYEDYPDLIFRPGPTITLKKTDEKTAELYRQDFASALMSYRWETLMAGRAMLGWIVSALVGGALEHRPALWLIAPSGSGKSYFLDEVLSPIYGPLLAHLHDPSEPGLASLMQNDSLPVYKDEAEPQKTTGGEQRWQALLGLIRASTSGKSGRLRGNAQGGQGALSFARFSILLSSINRPVMTQAEYSRFFMIRLSLSGVKNWGEVRDRLKKSLTLERAAAIRGSIIRSAQTIVDEANEISDYLIRTSNMATRESQIIGALSAGSHFMSGDGTIVERDEPPSDDNFIVLGKIFGYLVNLSARAPISLSEALHFSHAGNFEMGELAARYGLRVSAAGDGSVWLAPSAPSLTRLLESSGVGSLDLKAYMASLPGVFWHSGTNGSRHKKLFAGIRYYYFRIPKETLYQIGFVIADKEEEGLFQKEE